MSASAQLNKRPIKTLSTQCKTYFLGLPLNGSIIVTLKLNKPHKKLVCVIVTSVIHIAFL